MQSLSRTTKWPFLLGGGGTLLIFMGLCCGCLSLAVALDPSISADSGSSATVTYLLAFFFLAVPMLVAGAGALWAGWRRHGQERRAAMQNLVLDLAQEQHGAVTAADLALRSTLPLERAQDFLEELTARGICRMDMAEDGTVSFVFPRASASPTRTITAHERPV